MLFRFAPFCRLLAVGVFLLLPHAAFAADIRPNCNLRILKLSSQQISEMQGLRKRYKSALGRISRDSRHNHQVPLVPLFEKNTFDVHHAQRIAQARYETDIQNTVAELQFYHEFFQLLNPEQQAIWLKLCLQP